MATYLATVYHRCMAHHLFPKKLIHPLVTICTAVVLAACTTVPVSQSPKSPERNTAQKIEQLQAQFLQGKQLFLNKKYDEAAALLLPLAKEGHLDAQYTVGYMYHYGYGLPRNAKEANRWITTAAARGHEKAQQALKILDKLEQQAIKSGTPLPPSTPAMTLPSATPDQEQ